MAAWCDDEPLCECHGEAMRWVKLERLSAGGYWRCRVKVREAVARYSATPAGRAVHGRAQARYDSSSKGRASTNRHRATERGRETQARAHYAWGRRVLAARIEAKRELVTELERELAAVIA